MQTSISFTDLCRLIGLEAVANKATVTWQFALRRVGAGDVLFRQGDVLRGLHVIRWGFFKSYYLRSEGEHVTAFSMQGDVLGMEGIGHGVHCAEACALTNAEVANVPYLLLAQAGEEHAFPAQVLLKLLARENERNCTLVSLLGYPNATARVAAFLLSQGEAFARIGYSRSSFILPMRNADIGSYLGLRGETVCRALAVLKSAGLLDRDIKSFVINDVAGLRAVAESGCAARTELRSPRSTTRCARASGELVA